MRVKNWRFWNSRGATTHIWNCINLSYLRLRANRTVQQPQAVSPCRIATPRFSPWKKPVSVDPSTGFRKFLGTLSAPRFRSVLSHWIYHCELERLYAKKGRMGNPNPRPTLFFSLKPASTESPRKIGASTRTGVASSRLSASLNLYKNEQMAQQPLEYSDPGLKNNTNGSKCISQSAWRCYYRRQARSDLSIVPKPFAIMLFAGRRF